MADANQQLNVVDRLQVPATYKGYSLDSVLAYSTPRFVSIEDRRLGCLYYILIFFVVLWVIGFQILYGNNHYKLFDVIGESRMSIQQPTKKGCNPRKPACEDNVRSQTELPYCESYKGDNASKLKHSSGCSYFDMVDLTPNGPGVNSLLVPTRIDTSIQTRGCSSDEDGAGACPKMWKTNSSASNTYVAGIEDYTVMIRSSYSRKGIRGHSFSHVGYYYQCKNKEGKVIKTDPCEGEISLEEIKCLPGLKCLRGDQETPPPLQEEGLLEVDAATRPLHRRKGFLRNGTHSLLQPSQTVAAHGDLNDVKDGVYAIPTGDVFSIRKILELAGLDLDTSLDSGGTPLRQRGTAISVNIEYTNMRHWGVLTGKMEVGYAYRIVEQPLDEVKEEIFARHQPSESGDRIMENRHGLMINGKVMGSFGTFNIVYLLVMLTTSLALLGVAQKIVDFVAIQLPSKHQEQYKKAKFEVHRPLEDSS